MERSLVWAVSLAGTAFVLLAWTGYRVHAADRESLEALHARLDSVAEASARPRAEPGARPDPELEGAVKELNLRLTRLENASRRSAIAAPPEEEARAPEPVVAEELNAGGERDVVARLELEGLLAQLVESGWDFSGSRADYERFLELARETDLLDERIADLEKRVSADPSDVEGRMALADAYVGKLMTLAGPEQGLWGGRAEEQWLAVAELDDGHWRAHSSLGTNYCFYPEVMGKGEDAIRHLERAREIQRHVDIAPEHVQTYLFLARLYERQGKRDEAREVLREGLRYHSGSQELEAALARMG